MTIALLLLAWPAAAQSEDSDYVIGARDVLAVTVWSQMDLSGRYTVGSDGTLTFPLVGAVKVEGLSVAAAAAELRRHLMAGYFQDPQLSVSVEEFRSQHVYVMGQVRQPGTYPLSGSMMVIDALALAGSTTEDAAPEALVVRASEDSAKRRPTLPEQVSPSEVIHVDVNDVQSGVGAQAIELHDGDTVFVPRAETVFVSGQVRNPGAYALKRNATVLQAVTLAGGLTDRGAKNRIRIIRVDAAGRREIRAKLEDPVRPGDTVVVPERFF
jgi:polysaccharide export outer membrane protein